MVRFQRFIQIESLEARAHDVLKFIPSLRNMLRPANRLPPEILSCIVQNFSDHAKDAATIIPLTHVCRYWRESIIFTPTNWTSISSRSRNIAALSLERAKGAPLKISLCTSEIGEDHWLPDLLVPYIQNTQTLDAEPLSAMELKRFLPNFPQSMPNLRFLALSTSQISWDRLIDPFEAFVPALNSLSLTYIPLYLSLLQLRTLTELNICDLRFNLHLDTLLDFLEENCSLTSASMKIRFTGPSLRSSRRRAAIENRLRYLRIACYDVTDGQALISSIALSKGAELVFSCRPFGGVNPTVNDVLSGISTTHFSNLLSPTCMKYYVGTVRTVLLFGPNGTASFGCVNSDIPFVEFRQLPLTSVRYLSLGALESVLSSGPLLFHHFSSFPALETFTIDHSVDLSHLSVLLSNPSASPSLKALGFRGCILTEEFMEELTRFAADRKNTGSAWLHRVVIVHWEGKFPSIASIRKLESHVPVVDVRIAEGLPADLVEEAFGSRADIP